jgi:hypothetical protein
MPNYDVLSVFVLYMLLCLSSILLFFSLIVEVFVAYFFRVIVRTLCNERLATASFQNVHNNFGYYFLSVCK